MRIGHQSSGAMALYVLSKYVYGFFMAGLVAIQTVVDCKSEPNLCIFRHGLPNQSGFTLQGVM